MSDDQRLITAKFQVPAKEVEAGLNGNLILKASLQSAAPETIQFIESIREDIQDLRDEVGNEYVEITNEVTTKVGYKLQVNNQEVASYTVEWEDAGDLIRMDYDDDNVVIIPSHEEVPFERGTIINVRQVGAGTTTIEPVEGVTLNSPDPSNSTSGAEFGLALVKVGYSEWDLVKGFKGVPVPEVNNFVTEVESYFDRLEEEIVAAERKAEVLQETITKARKRMTSEFENMEEKVTEKQNQMEKAIKEAEEDLKDTFDRGQKQLSSELTILEDWVDSISDQNSEQSDDLNDIQQELLDSISGSWFKDNQHRADDGWQELPGGLIVQWIQRPPNPSIEQYGNKRVFEWPKRFPTKCLIAINSGVAIRQDQNSRKILGSAITDYGTDSVSVEYHGSPKYGGGRAGDTAILALGY